MQKPGIPKGTRDFSPEEMAKRNYIFDTIKSVFKLYGFQQIETPAMENLSTLMGKYGDEGDKLLFKILNSGDFLQTANAEALAEKNSVKLINSISEKGLRYDLTVPFARYVVQHNGELTMPFKRYQIQPVWRADRPQKGRYREFYQCDADVVGSDSLLNEAELVQIVDEVFARFGVNVTLKVNNRKILSGIAEIVGELDRLTDITVAIDKLDKIGLDNVNAELREKGVSAEAVEKLQPIILLSGSNEEKLATLKNVLAESETGLKGIEEIETILGLLSSANLRLTLEIDLTLARGLNYYTGAIFEVKANDVEMGSISGGGRYDNLTGVFGLQGLSGVGISFGADRIYDVLNQLNLYPKETVNATKILFVCFGDAEIAYSM
ncbi:MAG: histidine--tRNA ligase, partial [Paludibacteraceae bacterium]|nr:histidine--tRNA ligase [Paludibacteraceae bacterium]